MTVTTHKITASEFLSLPEVQGEIRELVQGEVVVSPRPNRVHAHVVGELFALLREHVVSNQLGKVYIEVDTQLADDEVRVPDIQFISNKHSLQEMRDNPEVVPDLCIEVISPGDIRTDRIDKFQLYQAKGVAHYWLIDPDARTLEGYSLENARYIPTARGADQQSLHLPPFPTLEIPLAKLWHP